MLKLYTKFIQNGAQVRQNARLRDRFIPFGHEDRRCLDFFYSPLAHEIASLSWYFFLSRKKSMIIYLLCLSIFLSFAERFILEI